MVVDFMINGVVSTAEELSSTPTIWPNPTSDIVNIDMMEGDFVKATLYNSYGHKLFTSSSAKIDLNDLPAGVYFLKVESKVEAFVKRLVKI